MESFETEYYRIKIFNDEGKKHADVEVPFIKGSSSVTDIRGRTVHPDGTVINCDGKVLEKLGVKVGGIKVLVKSFALPDVQPGSIIEYKYKTKFDPLYYHETYWLVQDNLFTRKAHFSIRAYTGPYAEGLFWRTFGKWDHRVELAKKGTLSELEMENIPGVPEEEFMPPEREIKMGIEFFYRNRALEKTEDFWKRVGLPMFSESEDFIGHRDSIRDAVQQIVNANDSPEAKLRKLYTRAQQIRNTSFEHERTEKEVNREKLRNKNSDEVLKHGYGTGQDINRLFIAFVRAAGFEADEVYGSARGDSFFHPESQDVRELTARLALVHLGPAELYLDPGTLYCPFGLLPWQETAAAGLRLTKQGGVLVTISSPKSSDAVIERHADLQLDDSGSLAGKVEILFAGQRALQHRLAAREEDETGREKLMKDEIKDLLPGGTKFELASVTGWEATDEPLRAQVTVQMPGYALSAGKRLLLPVGIFEWNQPALFQKATRVENIYFSFPYQTRDEVTIQLPKVLRVESLPPSRMIPVGAAQFESAVTEQAGVLRIHRRFELDGFYFPANAYPAIRAFFSNVKVEDDKQAVLQHSADATGN